MKYGKMKKATYGGSGSYQTPYSDVKSGGSDTDSGYVAGGLDMMKVIPGKGKKTAKPAKKARRAY